MEHIIDCKGLKCPQPVINTKNYFDSIGEGEAVIIVDDEAARENISKFAQSEGFRFSIEEKEALYYILVKKEPTPEENGNTDRQKFTIVITSNMLGNGDPKLGIALMNNYIYSLSECDRIPTDLIFINSGVYITTEGSGCINYLQKLKDRGVTISSCGACLDFYSLEEKLMIGEVTNMYIIVTKMNNSLLTITL